MTERLQRDIDLLRGRYPEVEFREEGQWVFLPHYLVPNDAWEHRDYAVCFQLRQGYPDIGPYGINTSPPPRGKNGQVPTNYVDNPEPAPPFPGAWGRLSWNSEGWRATSDLVSGHTLLNYVESFRQRFEEGP